MERYQITITVETTAPMEEPEVIKLGIAEAHKMLKAAEKREDFPTIKKAFLARRG